MVQNIAFTEKMGDSAFVFLSESMTAYKIQLSTNQLLNSIDFSTYADAGDTVTSVKYHHQHGRLYVALASGVIVYFTQNSNQATYFYTAERNVQSMAEAGKFLLTTEFALGGRGIRSSGGDLMLVLKGSGLLVNTYEWFLDDLDHAFWNSADEHIYANTIYNGLLRRPVDQSTGELGRNTYNGTGSDPWVFSPDFTQAIGAGHAYTHTDTGLKYNQRYSSAYIEYLIWPNEEGFVSVEKKSGDTLVEHRTADLVLNDTTTFVGEPLELFYEDSTIYVITGSPELGISINTFTPSTSQ